MDEDNPDDSPKQIPLRDLKVDPAAEDLLDSAAMEPYLNLAVAMMGGKDTGPAIEELAVLPREIVGTGWLVPRARPRAGFLFVHRIRR
jgi:hypothetical protein